MRPPTLAPAAYRRITLVALLALAFIVVTGGAVRLTGSGLGCPDWPTCEQNQLVAPLEYHAMVEFVNRTVTGIVSIAVILAVLGSLIRVPRRTDLIWLSAGLVAGVIGQIVLGGLTVLFHLWPPLVMGHFVLSMVLICNAVVLHKRAGQDAGPARALVPPRQVWLGRATVAMAAVVVLTGTVVTAAGPHGGDEDVDRLPVAIPDVARIHGVSVMAFLALVVTSMVLLHRVGASAAIMRRAETLLLVLVAQAAIGYTQYFTDVPALLVGFHIAGATAVWIATLWFHLGLSSSSPAVGRASAPLRRPAAMAEPVS
jgi:cytochrome c oxidase assembly protein subunit 15